MTRESLSREVFEDAMSVLRAGHCAFSFHTGPGFGLAGIGYRKAWNYQVQVCCKDLWYLETEKPAAPGSVQWSVRASTLPALIAWRYAGAVSLLQMPTYCRCRSMEC